MLSKNQIIGGGAVMLYALVKTNMMPWQLAYAIIGVGIVAEKLELF